MMVTVDQSRLQADELGLQTVGQVLSHLKRSNRLVVHVLIDGQEPDLTQMAAVRRAPLNGHTVFIETTDPREMARSVLSAISQQLQDADAAKADASALLQKGQTLKAMEKLSGCFTAWQHAQQSLSGTAQLMNLNLSTIFAAGKPVSQLLEEFTQQLRDIKSALENRDFVSLSDILLYETADMATHWSPALAALAAHCD
jgi:hypothetical protein